MADLMPQMKRYNNFLFSYLTMIIYLLNLVCCFDRSVLLLNESLIIIIIKSNRAYNYFTIFIRKFN